MFDEKFSKSKIREIVLETINKIKVLRTAQNPHEDVPWGTTPANIVILNVFYKSFKRNTYSPFPSNKHFICVTHYYENGNCPRLKDGGLPLSIWEQLKKVKIGNCEFAWNPNF